MNEQTSRTIDDSNTYGDFCFVKEVLMGDEIWKIYGRKMFDNPIVLHPKTFVPYKPFDQIIVEERIGIYKEKVRRFPSVAQSGQTFLACNTETNGTEEITI